MAKIAGVTAAVLAGGMGKRLRPITYFLPKPMVNVGGRPFLDYILEMLSAQGISKCVLLTGYKHGVVERHCGNGSRYKMRIAYSFEKTPLGTGGALLNAKEKLAGTVLVMNGDSWVGFDIVKLLKFHRKRHALVSVLAMKGGLAARGAIVANNRGRVLEFGEKKRTGEGTFNTGVYLVEQKAIALLAQKQAQGALGAAFSLEREGFPLFIAQKKLYACVSEGDFVDIGTFESLATAHSVIRNSRRK